MPESASNGNFSPRLIPDLSAELHASTSSTLSFTNLLQSLQRRAARIFLPRDHPHLPSHGRIFERPDDEILRQGVSRRQRQCRRQRHAVARRRHRHQRLQTRRAHVGCDIARKIGGAADRQRLIAQAMAIGQKQQRIEIDIGRLDRLLLGERVVCRQRQKKTLLRTKAR